MLRELSGPFLETIGRSALAEIQIKKLQLMLEPLLRDNTFVADRMRGAEVERPEDVASMADYRRLPFTTKEQLAQDQAEHPPYGTNLTFPRDAYTRFHQTSATSGQPLYWLDTLESWAWWARCWESVYRAAAVTAEDRVFFAFSFGLYIGFWGGFAAAKRVGAMVIPGGGMSTQQRVRAIAVNDVTVVVCTPSYALHMAEVAEQIGVDLPAGSVRVTIHAGEPGASIPSTKGRLDRLWGATCFDHAGSTEVGAWGFECGERTGLHINEGEFIAEVLDPSTGEPADEGELVVTNLGRIGMPVIRYRTGDRVRRAPEPCGCGRSFARLDGGVIGRIDDAIGVRGVNVFPSAIEDVVRRFPEVGEFAVDVFRRDRLDEIEIRIEVAGADPDPLAKAVTEEFRNALGLRVHVRPVGHGTLPHFAGRTQRFVDHRVDAD